MANLISIAEEGAIAALIGLVGIAMKMAYSHSATLAAKASKTDQSVIELHQKLSKQAYKIGSLEASRLAFQREREEWEKDEEALTNALDAARNKIGILTEELAQSMVEITSLKAQNNSLRGKLKELDGSTD